MDQRNKGNRSKAKKQGVPEATAKVKGNEVTETSLPIHVTSLPPQPFSMLLWYFQIDVCIVHTLRLVLYVHTFVQSVVEFFSDMVVEFFLVVEFFSDMVVEFFSDMVAGDVCFKEGLQHRKPDVTSRCWPLILGHQRSNVVNHSSNESCLHSRPFSVKWNEFACYVSRSNSPVVRILQLFWLNVSLQPPQRLQLLHWDSSLSISLEGLTELVCAHASLFQPCLEVSTVFRATWVGGRSEFRGRGPYIMTLLPDDVISTLLHFT